MVQFIRMLNHKGVSARIHELIRFVISFYVCVCCYGVHLFLGSEIILWKQCILVFITAMSLFISFRLYIALYIEFDCIFLFVHNFFCNTQQMELFSA